MAAVALLAPSPIGAQHIRLAARLPGGDVDLGLSRLPATADERPARLMSRVAWTHLRSGLDMATVELRAGLLGAPVHAVLLRLDPRTLHLSLQQRTAENRMTGTWRVDSAPDDAALALNAGQFKETGPWGWLVLDGAVVREPARAPLAISLAIDSAGRLHWIRPGDERAARRVRFAFQSFPLLLLDGRVPRVLRDPSLVDLGHRDARLMLAELADRRLLAVLTRFGGASDVVGRVPIGLTTPEALALVVALGARHAVMLDGGISAQVLVRDATGLVTAWPGLRPVPVGLIASPAPAH